MTISSTTPYKHRRLGKLLLSIKGKFNLGTSNLLRLSYSLVVTRPRSSCCDDPGSSAHVMIITLTAACLIFELSLAANPCTTSTHSDGCSIPGDLPFLYKETFTPNCNQHDICYFCAVQYGLVRHDCDNLFLKNMEASCNHLNRKRFLFGSDTTSQPTHHVCMASAYVYYEAVYLGAESHFEHPSPSWCGESWVRQCLP